MKFDRRSFLKVSAAAAAAASAPQILVGRARAATPAFGQVKHVLLFFTRGGLRSHPLFNAVGGDSINPFGALSDYQTVAPGTQWAPGALNHNPNNPGLDRSVMGINVGYKDIDLTGTTVGEVVPGFHQITNDIAVVPCVDHNPGGTANVNHDTATQQVATGDSYGLTGLLSRIGLHHPMYANGFSVSAPPPVEVQGTEFGLGAAEYAATRPLTLQGAGNAFTANLPIGQGWKIGARDALNNSFRDRRSRAFRARISDVMLHKGNTALFAGMLQDSLLDITGNPTATDAGVSNQDLLDILGHQFSLGDPNRANVDPGVDPAEPLDMNGPMALGPDVALALRFFSFGSPIAVVTRSAYDMHDSEATGYRPRVLDITRQLSGLNYLLKRMPHPSGGTYWDHTLVTIIGEFSRNNTLASGFNSGNGSDHTTNNAGPARNQAIPFMGGPVTAAGNGGRLFGSTDTNINATGPVYSSRSFLSTILDGLGIDPAAFWGDPAIDLYTP